MVDAFSVFDLDGDGKVTEAELLQTPWLLSRVYSDLSNHKVQGLAGVVF